MAATHPLAYCASDEQERLARIEAIVRSLKQTQPEPVCAYLYDLVALERHVSHIMVTLPQATQFFYAIKANAEARLLQTLASVVHGFEVASLGEIEKVRAVDAQIPIIFGGPGKTDSEIEGAIRLGAQSIHVESLHELQRVEQIGKRLNEVIPILLRINLGSLLPSATIHMAGTATQFGIEEAMLPAAIAQIRSGQHLDLQGFHFHSLSNNLDPEAHVQLVRSYIDYAIEWAERYNLQLSVVNAGGGLGVNYRNLTQQFNWSSFTQGLERMLTARLPADWTLLFECGRYVTAACGYYAVEVLDIKRNHNKYFVIVRGGTHHFRLPASWQHNHPFVVVATEPWSYPFSRPEVCRTPVTIVGQLCTPKDVFARDVPIAHVRVGDIILFQYAGAYGWAISHHNFLSHPHPQCLFIHEE